MNLKKLTLLLFGILVFPSIALASWWNPLSWSVFHKAENKTRTLELPVKEPEKKLEVKKEVVSATTTVKISSPKATSTKVVPKTIQAKSKVNNIAPVALKQKLSAPVIAVPAPTPIPIVVVLPVPTASSAVEADTSGEISLKKKAIDMINKEMVAIRSFDDFFAENIRYMNKIKSTGTLLDKSKVIRARNEEMITALSMEISYLESKPSSYFATYKIPQNHSTVLAGLPDLATTFIDQYNAYVDSSPSIKTQLLGRTHCTFNGIGDSGRVNIVCN
jgi:hypothetical protein